MKKIISVVIILLLVIVIGLPFATGIWIQQQYPKMMDRVSSIPNLSVKVTDFNRGWFSSEGTLQVTVKSHWLKLYSPGSSEVAAAVTLHEKIKHGPIIFTKTPSGIPRIIFARALVISTANDPRLSFESATVWTWSNKLKSIFHTTSDINLGDDQEKLSLSGLTGRTNYSAPVKKVFVALSLESGAYEHKQMGYTSLNSIQVNNLNYLARFNREGYLSFGHRHLSVDALKVSTASNQSILINSILATMDQKQAGENTEIKFDSSAQNLVGAGLHLGTMQFVLSVTGLNTQALNNLISQSMTQDESSPQALATLYEPLMQLLGKGLSVQLEKFSFQTDNGLVDVNAGVSLPKQAENPSLPYLLKHIQMMLHLQVPNVWLHSQLVNYYEKKAAKTTGPVANTSTPEQLAKQQIDEWIDKNYLVADSNNNLLLNAAYEDGGLLVNGKPLQNNETPQQSTTAPNQNNNTSVAAPAPTVGSSMASAKDASTLPSTPKTDAPQPAPKPAPDDTTVASPAAPAEPVANTDQPANAPAATNSNPKPEHSAQQH